MTHPLKLLIALAAISTTPAVSWCAAPWDVPFAGDPKAILEGASAIKPAKDAAVVFLLEEWRVTIDRSGRMNSTVRRVYQVVAEDEVEDWGEVEHEYAPWHEGRPELRARVITRDGAVHWLDDKTVADAPALQFDATVFSDNRTVRAPLPAVAPGAVVEYEITTRETAPALEAGTLFRIAINSGIATERIHLSIDAAPGIPLKKNARLIPEEQIHESRSKKGTHIEVDAGPFAAKTEWEAETPSDVPPGPVFEFSTAQSWQSVAAEYAGILNRQIARADLAAILPASPAGETDRDRMARIVAALHDKIRYTGVEFGRAAIEPRTPAESIARGYGDCKDKAALLVAMLRAAGFRASVALLLSGTGLDLSPELPGFGLFDHAIVRVDAPQPLWIDATASTTRVGDLPPADQGRLALIADGATAELIRTPESESKDNRAVHRIEMRMSESGPGTLIETVEGSGFFEAQMRELYGDPARAKDSLERQMKNGYRAESLGEYSAMPRNDFTRPYRIVAEARRTPIITTLEDEAVAAFSPVSVFQQLSYTLRANDAPQTEPARKPRQADFVFSEPHQCEYRFLIKPLPLFRVKTLPEGQEIQQGTFRYSQSYRALEDGAVEAVFSLDTGKRRLTAAEFESLREKLKPALLRHLEMLQFVSAPAEAIALGDVKEAVHLVQDMAGAETGGPLAQRARVLTAAADTEGAIAAGRKAVSIAPESVSAWLALASAYEHDPFGREQLGDWNPEESLKALRKAVECDKNGYLAKLHLAARLEQDATRAPGVRKEALAEAIGIYRDVLKQQPADMIQTALVLDLLRAARLAEAESEAKKLAPSSTQQSIQLAIIALRDSPARAVINSQSEGLAGSQRATLLFDAARMLCQTRHYSVGADLAKAAQRILPNPQMRALIELIGKMKPHEEEVYPPTDPRFPARALLVAAFSGANADAASSLFATPAAGRGKDMLEALRRRGAAKRRELEHLGISSEFIEDALTAGDDLIQEGDDERGYQISSPRGELGTAFVVKEAGGYRVLATWDQLAPVGDLVLELLRKGDLRMAQMWLDRLASFPVVVQLARRSHAGEHTPAVRNLWSGSTPETRDARVARIAAASVIAEFAPSDAAIFVLREARRSATDRVERGNIDAALCEAYAKMGRSADLLATARSMEGTIAVAGLSFGYLVEARQAARQWPELEQDAEAKLRSGRPDSAARYIAAFAALASQDYVKAGAHIQALQAEQWVDADSRVLIGWYRLLKGAADEQVLKLAEERVGGDDADSFYVLGLLQAALGRPDEARHSLANGLAKDDAAALDAKPWVLLGKIQELYGLDNAAKSSYAKAKLASRRDQTSVWALSLLKDPAK
ncbi:MAG TPA: DUF3857 domain-containing protein [Bryobacteraceae bacterium]|nr:DUF3857 domain-containing protein [Bryobacteraceae bacterium]